MLFFLIYENLKNGQHPNIVLVFQESYAYI